MLKLRSGHQNYEWGKLGAESLVYKLRSFQTDNLPIDKPYAELWMGTHPNLPSFVETDKGDMVKLSDLLQQEPEKYLGKKSAKFNTNNDLPFLFKILSVAKPLSIQAHPDKKLAELLHKQSPKEYRDDNHKPEMAIALSEFRAFCNFTHPERIITNLDDSYFLKDLFTSTAIEKFKKEPSKDSLKALIEELFSKKETEISEAIAKTVEVLSKKQQLTKRDELTLLLHKEFPFDIGIVFTYFMNYVVLQPGEALLMEAGEPHCYIYGDCVESK
jgi:mannose-6-phosphate isomerase